MLENILSSESFVIASVSLILGGLLSLLTLLGLIICTFDKEIDAEEKAKVILLSCLLLLMFGGMFLVGVFWYIQKIGVSYV